MNDFLNIARERGFLHQTTDEEGLKAYLSKAGGVAYIGFDCTAPSLHVGSLLQIMLLRWWQKCGHKPIVLLGGGTTKIGDPSGKDASRPALTDADIAGNMAGIKQVFEKFISFGDGQADAKMVNNDDWLRELNYVSFLRDYGRHFSVNRMLTMDSVKLRLERDQHLSFLEFNYMILQAYDFVALNKEHGCRVQLGGSDQWGNIVMGIELDRRARGDDEAKDTLFGITSPLITTASGAKMGKTADGAVWLNENQCSAYDYWQFWRNAEDADVGKFLKLFTELPMAEIAKLEALEGAEINEAKKVLATEATALLHGREAAEKAAATAQQTFEQGGVGGDLPEVAINESELAEGIAGYALLVKAGFAASNGEARRLVKGGGARLNDEAFGEDFVLNTDGWNESQMKLSAGKKRHALLKRA